MMELRFLLPLLSLSSTLLLHPSTSFTQPSDVQLSPTDTVHVASARTKLYHPATGLCVLKKSLTEPLKLGPCSECDAWYYTPQKFLTIKGTYYCLQAVGPNQPAKLSIICTVEDSQWMMESDSENKITHLSSKLSDGTAVCLDANSDQNIMTSPCLSFSSNGVDGQWFKMITGDPKTSQVDDIVPLE